MKHMSGQAVQFRDESDPPLSLCVAALGERVKSAILSAGAALSSIGSTVRGDRTPNERERVSERGMCEHKRASQTLIMRGRSVRRRTQKDL